MTLSDTVTETTYNPYQSLLKYLLRILNQNHYRRYNNSLYVLKDDGQWEEYMSIPKFVYKMTLKETNYHQWKNATYTRFNMRDAIHYLSNDTSEEIPVLHQNEGVFFTI